MSFMHRKALLELRVHSGAEEWFLSHNKKKPRYRGSCSDGFGLMRYLVHEVYLTVGFTLESFDPLG